MVYPQHGCGGTNMWNHGLIPNNKWLDLRIPNTVIVKFLVGELVHIGHIGESRMTKTWGWTYTVYTSADASWKRYKVRQNDVIWANTFNVSTRDYRSSPALSYAQYPAGTIVYYVYNYKTTSYHVGIVTHDYNNYIYGVYNGDELHDIRRANIIKVYNNELALHPPLGPRPNRE